MAELMLGQPLFPGESGIDQLVEIIKVLGTPTRDQIRTMNPNYMEHKFPQIKPHPFNKVRILDISKSPVTKALTLLRSSARPTPMQLISSQNCSSTRLLNVCPLSRPWCTHSSTSSGILTSSFLTLATPMAHPRTCLTFSNSPTTV